MCKDEYNPWAELRGPALSINMEQAYVGTTLKKKQKFEKYFLRVKFEEKMNI